MEHSEHQHLGRVGRVTHYYPKVGVAIVELSDRIAAGNTLHYVGKHTDFVEPIASMQIEHASISEAKQGDVVGIKVEGKVQEGDEVFRDA